MVGWLLADTSRRRKPPAKNMPTAGPSAPVFTFTPPPGTPVDSPEAALARQLREDAMRLVLHGVWVRKFMRSGKSAPHVVFLRMVQDAPQPTVEWASTAEAVHAGAGRREVVLGADAGMFGEAFLGDTFLKKHPECEALCFSLQLATRTIYCCAFREMELECLVEGVTELVQNWGRSTLQSLWSRAPPAPMLSTPPHTLSPPPAVEDDGPAAAPAPADGTTRRSSSAYSSSDDEGPPGRRLSAEAVHHCANDEQFAAALRDTLSLDDAQGAGNEQIRSARRVSSYV
jgi:hypothetical protein